jgi:hypothetical protein
LQETIGHTGRLLEQTDQRLAGNRVIPDRLVSLADPDARAIRKGKPQRPTQFSYTLLVAEEERGFICDHQLQQGNPPDAPQLVPAVERVAQLTSRVAGTVVGDRGFGTPTNDRALAERGAGRAAAQGHRERGPGAAGADPGVWQAAQLAGRHRGQDQPPQVRVRAAAQQAAATAGCQDLGRAWSIRLQPAADDGGGRA